MTNTTKCNCSVCERTAVFYKHLETIDPAAREYFERLYDDLVEVEMDRDYYKVIVHGTWPNADAVIQHIRATMARRAE